MISLLTASTFRKLVLILSLSEVGSIKRINLRFASVIKRTAGSLVKRSGVLSSLKLKEIVAAIFFRGVFFFKGY